MPPGSGEKCDAPEPRSRGEVERGRSQQEDQEGPGYQGHEESGDGDQEAHGRSGGFALSPGPSAPASVTPEGPPKL